VTTLAGDDEGVAAAPRRGFGSLADMARSLGVVLAAVLVLFLITIRTPGQSINVVDYQPTLQQAKVGAPFVLVAPAGLSRNWRPTSDYFEPPEVSGTPGVTLWHIGFVTPRNAYAGFEQTNDLPGNALNAEMSSPVAAGSALIGGVVWQRWTGGGRRALVLTRAPVTIVVDGSASWAELGQLAGSLRSQSGSAAGTPAN
jgi:Protein of unknown function (DUF4245)